MRVDLATWLLISGTFGSVHHSLTEDQLHNFEVPPQTPTPQHIFVRPPAGAHTYWVSLCSERCLKPKNNLSFTLMLPYSHDALWLPLAERHGNVILLNDSATALIHFPKSKDLFQ